MTNTYQAITGLPFARTCAITLTIVTASLVAQIVPYDSAKPLSGERQSHHDISVINKTESGSSAPPHLLLAATKRPDSLGGCDLYVSHKLADGKWSEPANLGTEINSPERELSPKLTPDGKYLIWTSCRLPALAAKPPKRTTDQVLTGAARTWQWNR